MKTTRALIVAILAGGVSYLVMSLLVIGRPEARAAPPERFPILSRFELSRDYGYFIGDVIPLTLVVETAGGVVLDLVNLPQTGEKHGFFEVRDLQLSVSSPSDGLTVYRAAYTLQYFGATPLMVHFAPLDILYALPDDRAAPTNAYRYKSLLTQPVAFNMSRIGPARPTHPLDLKGPVTHSRAGMIWASVILGTGLLCAATGARGREWYRHRQLCRTVPSCTPTPAEHILAILRQEGAALHPIVESVFPGVGRLSYLVRQYLHDALGVAASTLTTTELAALIHDKPFCQDLLSILERCDALKYQTPDWSQTEARQLWWEALTLFEKLQKAD
jgi:hypothetical protein